MEPSTGCLKKLIKELSPVMNFQSWIALMIPICHFYLTWLLTWHLLANCTAFGPHFCIFCLVVWCSSIESWSVLFNCLSSSLCLKVSWHLNWSYQILMLFRFELKTWMLYDLKISPAPPLLNFFFIIFISSFTRASHYNLYCVMVLFEVVYIQFLKNTRGLQTSAGKFFLSVISR